MKRKYPIFILLIFTSLLLCSCNIIKQDILLNDSVYAAESESISLQQTTKIQQNISEQILSPTPSPTPTPSPLPSPTPTPTATPTPVPTLTPEEEAALIRVGADYTITDDNLKLLKEYFYFFAPTVNMSFDELVGDNGNWDFPIAYPSDDTYLIRVDLRHCIVSVYTSDENGDYIIPVRFMLCSPGASGSSTPTGAFSLGKHHARFGYFVSTGGYAQYWTQITGRIYMHSILYSERDAATYTNNSWRALGTKASHGCVRLTVPDARWIWYNAAHGSKVEIFYGAKDDLLANTIKELLVLAPLPDKRPALKPGKVPYTDNWEISDIKQDIPFEQGTAVRK